MTTWRPLPFIEPAGESQGFAPRDATETCLIATPYSSPASSSVGKDTAQRWGPLAALDGVAGT